MKLLSKILLRSIYAVAAFAFVVWQILIYSGFTFTFTGNEGIGVKVFTLIAFGLDIPLALASIAWPKVGLIGMPANIALTIIYMLGAALRETFHHLSAGWPGTMPLLLLFIPKLILIGLLALLEYYSCMSSRRFVTPAVLD